MRICTLETTYEGLRVVSGKAVSTSVGDTMATQDAVENRTTWIGGVGQLWSEMG